MKKEWVQGFIPFSGLIAVIILFASLTSGNSLAVGNMKLIGEQAILVIVASIGVLLVMTIGSIDFSQGSIVGIGSIVATLVSNVSIPLAVLSAAMVGIIIGFANGFIHVKLRVPSFIVTLCTMFVFRGITAFITREKPLLVPMEIYSMDKLFCKLSVLVLLLAVGYYVFTYTKVGRNCRAIGAGETASRYAGVQVDAMKILAFTFAGLMGGIASFFNIIRVGSATANTGSLFETDILIALVLGGLAVTGGAKSRFSSVIIGGVLLAVLSNGLVLLGVDITVQQLIKGAVFLGSVALTVERGSVVAVK
jgi:ribose transport system permease protein